MCSKKKRGRERLYDEDENELKDMTTPNSMFLFGLSSLRFFPFDFVFYCILFPLHERTL